MTSVWQPVYYRVWQTKSSDPNPVLLLDENEMADILGPIHARANENDVTIEYEIIGDDAFRVPEFRHYALEAGKLRRTDPVALTPQDFVSFWLRHPWTEVSHWTAPAGAGALKAWRDQYKGTNSEFDSPTRHCTREPDLWQVAAAPGLNDDANAHYFIVRIRPPFRFTMIAASDRPRPDCTEAGPAVDLAPDLFDN